MRLKEKAYSEFREKLFNLELMPGQFVTQSELSDLLNVPISPLREALQRLDSEGLVSIIPQRGIQIREHNVKFIKEAFQLRIIFEKEAVRYFTKEASDALVGELEKAPRDILKRRDKKGIDAVLLKDALQTDWSFHETIIDFFGNDLVRDVFQINFDKIKVIRLNAHYTPDRLSPGMKEHIKIIEAVKKRDPQIAAEALEGHLKTAMMRALGL